MIPENNGRLSRLLINTESISEAVQRSDVKRMLENEGMWIAGDTRDVTLNVPLASMGGKVYAMKRDQELDPDRFLATLTLAGPFTAQKSDPAAWVQCAIETPEPDTLVLMWFATGDIRVGHFNATVGKWCPPRRDRFLRVQPTHWQSLADGPGGKHPVLVPD